MRRLDRSTTSLQKPSVRRSIDRAVEVGVGDAADHRVVARIGLGQADAAVLRIGEAAVGDDRVVQRAVRRPEGVLRGDPSLVGRALHEHHPPGHVAGGPDVRHRRAQRLVDGHVSPRGLDAGGVEPQVLEIAGPPHRQDDGVGQGLEGLVRRTDSARRGRDRFAGSRRRRRCRSSPRLRWPRTPRRARRRSRHPRRARSAGPSRARSRATRRRRRSTRAGARSPRRRRCRARAEHRAASRCRCASSPARCRGTGVAGRARRRR